MKYTFNEIQKKTRKNFADMRQRNNFNMNTKKFQISLIQLQPTQMNIEFEEPNADVYKRNEKKRITNNLRNFSSWQIYNKSCGFWPVYTFDWRRTVKIQKKLQFHVQSTVCTTPLFLFWYSVPIFLCVPVINYSKCLKCLKRTVLLLSCSNHQLVPAVHIAFCT